MECVSLAEALQRRRTNCERRTSRELGSSATANCHPERSEGSWFWRAAATWAARAETKIPFDFAQGRLSLRSG